MFPLTLSHYCNEVCAKSVSFLNFLCSATKSLSFFPQSFTLFISRSLSPDLAFHITRHVKQINSKFMNIILHTHLVFSHSFGCKGLECVSLLYWNIRMKTKYCCCIWICEWWIYYIWKYMRYKGYQHTHTHTI